MSLLHPDQTCIIFVDLIDSSTFSSFVGLKNYAKWIIKFQDEFKDLSGKYFGKQAITGTAGDEGHAFIIKQDKDNPVEILYKAICFVLELKAIIKFLPYTIDNNSEEHMPYGLRLAVGIHYGEIICDRLPNREDKFIGYNINYAKRIETCSREGIFSNIYVSRRVHEILISQKPILFEKRLVELRGLEHIAEIYEVKSAFINQEDMREVLSEDWEKFIKEDKKLKAIDIVRKEYWFESYFLSILYQFYKKYLNDDEEKKLYYIEKFEKRLFQNINVNDSIIIFIQAVIFAEKKDLTLAINKLKCVLENHPELIKAKLLMIKLLSEIKEDKNKHDLYDSINELIKYYPDKLTQVEHNELINILQNC